MKQEFDTTQALRTALHTNEASPLREPPSFFQTIEEPAFAAIINSISLHATERNITEIEAAREVLRVFRKIDTLWNQHLIQSSVEETQKH